MSPAQLSYSQTVIFAITFSAIILTLLIALYAWAIKLYLRPSPSLVEINIELNTIESFVVGAPTPLPPAHLA